MASPTDLMFSASSSGISTSNSSSMAITSSTMSRLSAPRSSMKDDSGLISSSPTPSWSAMMFLTLASIADVAMLDPLSMKKGGRHIARPSLHVHAAVHLQYFSGDVCGEVGCEERDRVGHVLRRPQPLQRNTLHHLDAHVGWDLGGHVGVDETG